MTRSQRRRAAVASRAAYSDLAAPVAPLLFSLRNPLRAEPAGALSGVGQHPLRYRHIRWQLGWYLVVRGTQQVASNSELDEFDGWALDDLLE